MHPNDIVWVSEGQSCPLWHPRWTDTRFFARATRSRPDVRDPNSHLRGRDVLSSPMVYRICELRLNQPLDIAAGRWTGDATRRLKGLRDFPRLGPFEFLSLIGEYELHPHWRFDLTPTEAP